MNKDLSRGNKYPLYPELEINEYEKGDDKVLVIETTLRIMGKDGKWYLWDFRYNCEFLGCDHENYAFQKNSVFERVIEDVYLVIILGGPDLSLESYNGEQVFYLDENQESETERLSRL